MDVKHLPASLSRKHNHRNYPMVSIVYSSLKKTEPSLNVQYGNDVFYGNAGVGGNGALSISDGETVYSVYDDVMAAEAEDAE